MGCGGEVVSMSTLQCGVVEGLNEWNGIGTSEGRWVFGLKA